jgi:rhomboid protease GluP
MKGGNVENLVKLGGLVPLFVRYFDEYYRLFTTMFLHGSLIHFLMNNFFGLLIICAGLERLIGSFRYFFIYLLSGLISSLFIVFIQDPLSLTVTVGASGAIYGVMGCFLYIIFFKSHLLSIIDQRYIRNLLIINLIFTFIYPSVSILGHLGGLLGGLLLSPLFLYNK